MNKLPILMEDGIGRKKLEVTLPGGRYQLSLDGAAVDLLCNDLGYGINDVVPEPFVPILVAVGDAWFPRQRDRDRVVDDLPADGSLTDQQRNALIEYLKTVRISTRNADLVKTALAASPVADAVAPEDLQINELPSIPDGIDMEGKSTRKDTSQSAAQDISKSPDESRSTDVSSLVKVEETDLCSIPGIGPHRAEKLLEGGYTTVAQIADSRPSDIVEATGIGEQLATVAVEGAREIIGYERPAAARLASETGVDKEHFDSALSTLAASGIPPSEAAPVLRLLYGPSLVEIRSVSGQQAYYLWEAGYWTPHEVATAPIEDLCDVPYIGQKTVTTIRNDACAIVHR